MLDLNYREVILLDRLLKDRLQKCQSNYNETNDDYWNEEKERVMRLIVMLEEYEENRPCYCKKRDDHDMTNECIPF